MPQSKFPWIQNSVQLWGTFHCEELITEIVTEYRETTLPPPKKRVYQVCRCVRLCETLIWVSTQPTQRRKDKTLVFRCAALTVQAGQHLLLTYTRRIQSKLAWTHLPCITEDPARSRNYMKGPKGKITLFHFTSGKSADFTSGKLAQRLQAVGWAPGSSVREWLTYCKVLLWALLLPAFHGPDGQIVLQQFQTLLSYPSYQPEILLAEHWLPNPLDRQIRQRKAVLTGYKHISVRWPEEIFLLFLCPCSF